MRLLDRKPLLDLSIPTNMQKIRELHPDAERPVAPIAAANLPPAPTLSPDDIVAALRSIDSWTASGLDLLSAHILKSVLDEVPGALCTRLSVYWKLGTRVDHRANPSAPSIGFGLSRPSSSTNFRIL
jgi:hypothetical protein